MGILKTFKKDYFIASVLFILLSLAYFISNPHPLEWYNHYVYLTDSLLRGRLDVPHIPQYMQDVVKRDGVYHIPFPPLPVLFLALPVAVWGTGIVQPYVAMLVGGLNIALTYLLFRKLKKDIKLSLFLSLFFAFGTVHWYASSIGTTWFLAHLVSVFCLLVSLHFALKEKVFGSALMILAAGLSRLPAILGLVTLLFLFGKKKLLSIIFVGCLFLGFALLYNYARFGNVLESGYGEIYSTYASPGTPAGWYRSGYFSFLPNFNLFDIRNIPLHLFTIFLMPPEISKEFPFFKPSPYGLSILLTSPLFIFAFFASWKNKFVRSLWLGVILIALPSFLHYSQGWVQFGYRFALDFMPLLMVLVGLGIQKIRPMHIGLWIWSITVNAWGLWWAIMLGW